MSSDMWSGLFVGLGIAFAALLLFCGLGYGMVLDYRHKMAQLQLERDRITSQEAMSYHEGSKP